MRKVQERISPPDVYLLGITAALVALGVLLVFDASYARTTHAKWANYDAWYMAKRQLAYAVIGLGAMLFVSRLRLTTFLRWTIPLVIVAIGMLVAVLIPGVGHRMNGASRWIKIGPICFQPSELAKIALVFYLAGVLAQRKMRIRRLSSRWLTPLAVVGLAAGLVFVEPDLGTTIAIVGTCFVMLFAAGAMKRHLAGLACGGLGLVAVAVAVEPYRLERFYTWLNPWRDRYGDGYQIIHSLIALGTGGVTGVGFCEGREKHYLPAASTDFVFATLAEEAGLIGGLVLLGLFVLFAYRGLDIARRSQCSYSNLLAVGMTSVVCLQALINVAVVSSAIPATGVPLPFISYGGSCLVLTLVGVGVLLSVSGQTATNLDERDLYENSLDGWRDGRAHLSGHKRRAGAARGGAGRGTLVRR